LHQVGDLFELNVKLRCQKVNVVWRANMSSGLQSLWHRATVLIKKTGNVHAT